MGQAEKPHAMRFATVAEVIHPETGETFYLDLVVTASDNYRPYDLAHRTGELAMESALGIRFTLQCALQRSPVRSMVSQDEC